MPRGYCWSNLLFSQVLLATFTLQALSPRQCPQLSTFVRDLSGSSFCSCEVGPAQPGLGGPMEVRVAFSQQGLSRIYHSSGGEMAGGKVSIGRSAHQATYSPTHSPSCPLTQIDTYTDCFVFRKCHQSQGSQGRGRWVSPRNVSSPSANFV